MTGCYKFSLTICMGQKWRISLFIPAAISILSQARLDKSKWSGQDIWGETSCWGQATRVHWTFIDLSRVLLPYDHAALSLIHKRVLVTSFSRPWLMSRNAFTITDFHPSSLFRHKVVCSFRWLTAYILKEASAGFQLNSYLLTTQTLVSITSSWKESVWMRALWR